VPHGGRMRPSARFRSDIHDHVHSGISRCHRRRWIENALSPGRKARGARECDRPRKRRSHRSHCQPVRPARLPRRNSLTVGRRSHQKILAYRQRNTCAVSQHAGRILRIYLDGVSTSVRVVWNIDGNRQFGRAATRDRDRIGWRERTRRGREYRRVTSRVNRTAVAE